LGPLVELVSKLDQTYYFPYENLKEIFRDIDIDEWLIVK
jgi:hypothetical protein